MKGIISAIVFTSVLIGMGNSNHICAMEDGSNIKIKKEIDQNTTPYNGRACLVELEKRQSKQKKQSASTEIKWCPYAHENSDVNKRWRPYTPKVSYEHTCDVCNRGFSKEYGLRRHKCRPLKK